MRSLTRTLAGLALALAAAPRADAASCQIVGVIGVAFGGYDPFRSGPLDTVGEVRLSCNDVQPSDLVVVELSKGSAPGFFPRTLRSGGGVLEYNLYVDSGRTAVWGDGNAGTARLGPFSPPGGGAVVELPVYARVPGGQNAPAGSYSDSVVVTLVF